MLTRPSAAFPPNTAKTASTFFMTSVPVSGQQIGTMKSDLQLIIAKKNRIVKKT